MKFTLFRCLMSKKRNNCDISLRISKRIKYNQEQKMEILRETDKDVQYNNIEWYCFDNKWYIHKSFKQFFDSKNDHGIHPYKYLNNPAGIRARLLQRKDGKHKFIKYNNHNPVCDCGYICDNTKIPIFGCIKPSDEELEQNEQEYKQYCRDINNGIRKVWHKNYDPYSLRINGSNIIFQKDVIEVEY